MFNKKELAAIYDKLNHIEQQHTTSVHELKQHNTQSIQELNDKIKNLQEKNFYYFEEFERNIASFRDLNIKYQKGIDELNLFKSDLATKTLEKVEKDIKSELGKHVATLSTEHTKIQELCASLELLKTEVQRLSILSHHIKQTDFELTNYLQKFQNEQNEKGKLSRDVDSLQSMIAKMRRGQHS